MAVDEAITRERLATVFARQDFFEACKRRDAGSIVRILGAHGITQGRVTMLTGIPQSALSRYKTGRNQAEFASTFEKIADGLGMPQRLHQALGLTGESSPARPGSADNGAVVAPDDTFDLIQLAEAMGRNGTSVKRREMLSLAAVLGGSAAVAQSEVWELLAYALTKPTTINEVVVKELEYRSSGFHRLEGVVSAPRLIKGLTAHLRELSTLLGTVSDPGDELRKRLLIVAGESSVLAGWAASDMGDSVTALNFYGIAAKAAKEAEDPEIIACALSYRSYIPSTKGANGRARVLLAEALDLLPQNSSPGALAWIAARHAEESAQLGDNAQALKSWNRAEEAYSVADPEDDRVWTRFLDQSRFDGFRLSTLAKMGRLEEAQEVAGPFLANFDQPGRKKAAIIFADMAAAYLARGAVNEAAKLAKGGLTALRETEFVMWLPKYEAITQALRPHNRQPTVRSYLEEFSMTKRQFASPS
jgi:tetratricopeptide (TPR) repeat protein